MALQIRRGTNAQRLTITPLQGELILVTDYISAGVSPLWVGDGTTVGGVTSATLSLEDLTDVDLTTPLEGHTLYYDQTATQWKNTGILSVDDVNNRVGVNDTTPSEALDVTGNIHATGNVITDSNLYANGDLYLNNDLGGVDVNIQFTTGRTLKWDHADQRYEFNTGDLYLTSDLIVGGNDIKSSGGTTALTLSGANVTVAGDLTVNGTTTTIESTTLVVDDSNITIGKDNTLDSQADGGGITLKGATDKTITWSDSTDRWEFNQPVYANNYISAAGDILSASNLYLNNDQGNVDVSIFFGTPTSTTDKTFRYDVSSGGFYMNDGLRVTGNVLADDDIYINYDNSDTDAVLHFYKPTSGSETLKWDKTNSWFIFSDRLEVDGYVSAGGALITDDNLTLNNDFGDVNAVIYFSKPTSGTETLQWNKTLGRFEFTTDLYTPQATIGNIDIDRTNGTITTNTGNLTLDSTGGTVAINDNLAVDTNVLYVDAANNRVGVNTATPTVALDVSGTIYGDTVIAVNGDLGTNGNDIYFNYDDGGAGATSSLTVKRGSNADVGIRWNETDDRWETTTDGSTYIQLPNQDLDTDASPSFAGVTADNIRVGVTGANEIDTSSGNLTIDSAGGTTTLDDDVIIAGDLQIQGGDLTTNQTTFNLLDTTATTINIGGAATTLSLGYDGTTPTSAITNISHGSIATANSQTVSIATQAQAGATTTVNIGSLNGTSNVYLNGSVTASGNLGFSGTGNINAVGTITGNTTLTLASSSNNNIVIAPNGTGDVQVDADTLRVGDSGAAATITTNGAGNLTLSTNEGTNSGTITINQGSNGNIVIAPNGTGDVQLDADTVRVGDNNATANIVSNGTGDIVLATNSGSTDTSKITLIHNGNIEINPDSGTTLNNGNLILGPSNTNTILTTSGTGDLTIHTNSGTNSGSILINDGVNGNIDITTNGTGRVTISGGLSVDTNTIYVDATNNIVGIATSSPGTTLDCAGSVRGQARLIMNSHNDVADAEALSGNTNFGHYIETGAGNETATLAAPTLSGTIQTFCMTADGGGDMVITVTNPAWGGAGTMTFNAVGQGCTLLYMNAKWCCIGNNGVTFG